MANPKAPPWKIDPKFKQKLTEEDAKLIFEEAEKAFNDSIETSIRILDRNTSLLQLVSGILVGLVAFSISRWEKNFYFDSLLITTIAGIVYFFLLGLLFIFPNIKPKIYVLPGTQPKKLFVDPVFDTSKENRVLHLYMIKITSLQEGIDDNRALNNTRWDYYKKSLNFLFYSPIFLICVYLLMNIIVK